MRGEAARWLGRFSSWVLSGFTPCASQTSHVQLWPRGSGQEARHWSEHSWNAVGTFCVCPCAFVWRGSGSQEADCYPAWQGLSLNPHSPPPPTPLNSQLPHPLCPLARHVPTQHPAQMHTQHVCTHRHEHTHDFNQRDAWPPVKRCDGNSK